MFSEEIDIFGTLYSGDIGIFSSPINTFAQFNAGAYKVSLGNRFGGGSVSEFTFFKEVKVFTSTFKVEDIVLFAQLSSYPASLLSYMRLNSGSNFFFDKVSHDKATTLVDVLNKQPLTAAVFQVCPVHTYASDSGQCLQNPFRAPKIFAFFAANSDLTVSALYSDMLAHETALTYSWGVSYPELLRLQLKNQITQGSMTIKTDTINGQGYGDQLQYLWTLDISNEIVSFKVEKEEMFALKRCRWLADKSTNESQVKNLLPNVRGQEDIALSFSVKEREACDEGGFYELLKSASVEIFPSDIYLASGLKLADVVTLEGEGVPVIPDPPTDPTKPTDPVVTPVDPVAPTVPVNGGRRLEAGEYKVVLKKSFQTLVGTGNPVLRGRNPGVGQERAAAD